MLTCGTSFSGVGAPEQALKQLGIPHVVKWACDIDKYAKQTYLANHSCEKWYDDITKIDVDELQPVDLYVWGFPCQTFSVAGNQAGTNDPRGLLANYSLEIIDEIQPKYFLFENVKGLLQAKFREFFDYILSRLRINYNISYKVLNSKNFGVPHHRERVFCLGVRKDLDQLPIIPESKPIKYASDCSICPYCEEAWCDECNDHYDACNCIGPDFENKLENILELDVDPKYYLSNVCLERIKRIEERAKARGLGYKNMILDGSDVMLNLDSSYYKGPDGKRGMIYVGSLTDKEYNYSIPHSQRVYSPEGLAVCLNSSCGNKTGKYLVKGKIRMLTERECARLQGFPDSFIIPVSRTQAYKQFGNTITVPVLVEIFKNLLTPTINTLV